MCKATKALGRLGSKEASFYTTLLGYVAMVSCITVDHPNGPSKALPRFREAQYPF